MTRVSISLNLDESEPIDWDAVGAAIARAGKAATPNRLGEIEHAQISGHGILGDLHASEWRNEMIGRQVELHSRADRDGSIVGMDGAYFVVRSDDGADVYVVGRSDFDLVD